VSKWVKMSKSMKTKGGSINKNKGGSTWIPCFKEKELILPLDKLITFNKRGISKNYCHLKKIREEARWRGLWEPNQTKFTFSLTSLIKNMCKPKVYIYYWATLYCWIGNKPLRDHTFCLMLIRWLELLIQRTKILY